MPIQTATETQPAARQVTLVQVSWTEQERGRPGALALLLLLDDEVHEYVLRAAPEEAAVLVEFLARSTNPKFDVEPRVPSLGTWAASRLPGPSPVWAEAALMQT
jgi:hypothetical protein